MKIKLLRQVMISGESVKAGSLSEVSYQDGIYLIALGKAVEAQAEPEKVEPKKVEPKKEESAEEEPKAEPATKTSTRKTRTK